MIINYKKDKTYEIANPNYDDLVNFYIREKYSLTQELSILRQKDTKPIEYNEYYDYAESCKIKAKNYINENS